MICGGNHQEQDGMLSGMISCYLGGMSAVRGMGCVVRDMGCG